MNPTRNQIRQLRRDNMLWPLHLADVPQSAWPSEFFGYNSGRAPRIKMLRSRDYLCQVFDEGHDILRLSFSRTDFEENSGRWKENITWDNLQRLKSEAGYGDRQAVEIYPEDGNIVNVANMRHLWVLPAPLPYSWRAA